MGCTRRARFVKLGKDIRVQKKYTEPEHFLQILAYCSSSDEITFADRIEGTANDNVIQNTNV